MGLVKNVTIKKKKMFFSCRVLRPMQKVLGGALEHYPQWLLSEAFRHCI